MGGGGPFTFQLAALLTVNSFFAPLMMREVFLRRIITSLKWDCVIEIDKQGNTLFL
jgi:hypothetical protein